MKTKMKKYPILISTIVSCLIIVVSLFILGFFGIKFGVSLGGGEQIEVVMEDEVTKDSYLSKINTVLDKHNYSVDTSFVEDKYTAGDKNTEFTRKKLIVQVASEFTEEEANTIQSEIASTLGVEADSVLVGKIVSSVVSKSALRIGIAFAIIALCFFVFSLVRYDIFAGLSFVIAYLHNIIVYFSLVIITRVQFTIDSLCVIVLLTLVMSAVLIAIYERFRVVTNSQEFDKTPLQEQMLLSEKGTVAPFVGVCVAILILVVGLLIVPSIRFKFIALNCFLALIVTAYTSLVIGPSAYVATLEIREMNIRAIMSRNDTVNKAIKKKVKKNTSK